MNLFDGKLSQTTAAYLSTLDDLRIYYTSTHSEEGYRTFVNQRYLDFNRWLDFTDLYTVLPILRDNMQTFGDVFLSLTEHDTDEEFKLETMRRLVDEKASVAPFDRFDSNIAALSLTGLGNWASMRNILLLNGLQPLETDLVNPDLGINESVITTTMQLLYNETKRRLDAGAIPPTCVVK